MRLLRSAGLSLLVALLATPGVEAQQASKKDELATEEKAAKDVTRPEEEIDALEAAENAEQEALIADKEKQLSGVRQRQIVEMRSILDKNPLYKKKADLLFRIAEKEWDEAKYRYFLVRKDYEKRYQDFLDGKLKKRPEEPVADYSKALVEYKKLLKEFPNYKRLDEVMFYLGRGLITAGKKKEGASYMLRLTKDYPKSKYLIKAYLAVAEYYFENDLLFAAKTNYLKVVEDEKATEYPYALYKLGYVYYNLKEYRDAIKSFQKVVELQKGADKRKVYFTNQAYSGLAMTYVEVDDGWKEARDYFRKQGGQELETEYLEKMASLYNRQDKIDEEIAVYEYLIGTDKQGKKVPEYADYITKAYKKQENIVKTDEVINRFLTMFDPKGSWWTVNKDVEESTIRASQYRENELDWLISWYHNKAQEVEKLKDLDRANEYYMTAAKYYEMFLAWFPKAKDLYEKEFFLAEIYFFQAKNWDMAAQHYGGVVTRDPKGKYSVESAYAVILCWEEKMASAGLIERPTRTKGDKKSKGKAKQASIEYVKRDKDDKFEPVTESPLHESEIGFVKACEDYVSLFPKDKEVPFVSFRAAEIYIKKGHYPEGIARLEVIMEHHPKHQYAGHAAATLFDSNYRLKRWDQMERWGRYMMKRKNYEVLNKDQLKQVIAVSINEYAKELRDQGEAERKAGNVAKNRELKSKAVEQWERFVQEFPKDDNAAIALYNAAAVTEELEKTEKAVDLYESVIKRYGSTDQAVEAHFVLGALYESQTDFETAADYFEKMASFGAKVKKEKEKKSRRGQRKVVVAGAKEDKAAKKEVDPSKIADSLYNAGAIRAALEQHDRAAAIFETYVEDFPEREDVPKIYLRIAGIYEKQSDWKKAQDTYDRYLKKYARSRPETVVEVHLRKAKVFQKSPSKGARRNASLELDLTLKAYKKLEEAQKQDKAVLRAAAEARFLQGEYVYQDFEAVVVAFPDHVLRKTLVKKAQLLDDATKIYFEVLEFNSHQVSAGALYRIGESFYLFAKSLFDLPIPAELNEDEQIIYRAELDDKAAPLQEKAIEAMQRALKLAHKNHVYNEWSRRSAALLVKLSPDAFPVLDDAVVNTEWEVPATFSTTYIADADGKLEQMVKEAPPKEETPAEGAPPGPGNDAAPPEKGGAAAPKAEAGEKAAGAAAAAEKEGGQ